MSTPSTPLTLIAIDDLDAAAWGLQHPELVDAVSWVTIEAVPELDHNEVGEVAITRRADDVSAGTPAVAWIIDHVRQLHRADPMGPSRLMRDAVDGDAA